MDKPDTEPSENLNGPADISRMLSKKLQRMDAHYVDCEPLGKGSYGEVQGARDTLLGRNVAIKFLHPQYRNDQKVVDRFLKEARGAAQLEHPNIMPVHEIGISEERGVYFTMKNVQGETLAEILERLEAKTSLYLSKYRVDVLLEIFLAVCSGVAFAHSKGVIHRDLNPSNIMIGEFGQVLVLDWGLVKKVDGDASEKAGIDLQMDELKDGAHPAEGEVAGTPNYMSPEQAEGRDEDIDYQSDIYSLGAILYHMLAHVPPFEKMSLRRLIESVKAGVFQPPRQRRPDLKIPRELEAVCLKAMSRFPVRRYKLAEQLAEDIKSYLSGNEVRAYKPPRLAGYWRTCRKNPIRSGVIAGLLVVFLLVSGTQRAMLHGLYRSNFADAEMLREQGGLMVDEFGLLNDALHELSFQTELKARTPRELELEALLEEKKNKAVAAFNVANAFYESIPDPYSLRKNVQSGYLGLIRKHIQLALHRGKYEEATAGLQTALHLIKTSGRRMDAEIMQELNAVERRINGDGSLVVDGPESVREVMIWPLANDGPRLVHADALARGKLPLTRELINRGAYTLMVTLESGGLMTVPFYIEHGERKQIELEIPAEVPEGMVYVSGGGFICGGDESRYYRRHKRATPAFFIKKHETTFAEYLEFWKSLSSRKERSEYMSRIRFSEQDARRTDAWDIAGNLADERLKPEYPVVGISRDAAVAFCKWKSVQTGTAIRLPTAFEWEKAARGVDGRTYVWGNAFVPEANLTHTADNEKGKARFPLWAPPGKFPRDVSAFNVYDMAGNVREMTSTPVPGSDGAYQIKGGSVFTSAAFLACSHASGALDVPSDVGFRYIQEIVEKK